MQSFDRRRSKYTYSEMKIRLKWTPLCEVRRKEKLYVTSADSQLSLEPKRPLKARRPAMGSLDICAARKQSRYEQSGMPSVMEFVTGMKIYIKEHGNRGEFVMLK